ncbi:MAG: uroporphyrinogen decarboxylase family protein, partial [Alphaproteobacteria bacterium]
VALIGFAGAAWTVACYMVEGGASCEFPRVRAWRRERPAEMQALIDTLSEITATHLIAQADAGADVLQLFDSWAGVLGEADFERWCIAPTARIVREVKRAHPHIPIIGFPNKAGPLYVAYAARTGVDAVSIDSTVPLRWAAGELQSYCAVQGNLDPYVLLSGGASLRDQARSIISVLGRGPFVFNLGHGILPQTPPEHVGELADVVRAWGS